MKKLEKKCLCVRLVLSCLIMYKNDPYRLENQREGNEYFSADNRKLSHHKAQREWSGSHSQNVSKAEMFIVFIASTLRRSRFSRYNLWVVLFVNSCLFPIFLLLIFKHQTS